jgi:hypothetical protein
MNLYVSLTTYPVTIEGANLTKCCQITVYEIIHRNEF